ncbi:hypothetical protein [Streptomyces kaniharaensis]|nr:hypothetical protein [Streptomyces kaniharaensis]
MRYGLTAALAAFALFTVAVAITALGQRGPLLRQAEGRLTARR